MNYIILDLEAACAENDRRFLNEIIEIGAVKVDNNLKIIDEFCSFVRPIYNPELTDFCRRLTTINQSDIDSAKGFPEVLSDFIHWIGSEPYVLCSWGLYDKRQLEKDCVLHSFDTGWLKRHISLKHQHGAKIMNKVKGVGMKSALNSAGLQLIGTHHRGIDDAKNVTQLFIKYFSIWDFDASERL